MVISNEIAVRAPVDVVSGFFAMLHALYGKSKFQAAWSSPAELAAAKALYRADIAKHSVEELSCAINNAKKMMGSGDDKWSWINIPQILACAPISYKNPTPEYQRTPEQEQAFRSMCVANLAKLKEALK